MDDEIKFDITTGDNKYSIVNNAHSIDAKLTQPSRNITFMNEDNKVVGELTWDDDVFKFEGNAEESAQVFFDCVIALMPVK